MTGSPVATTASCLGFTLYFFSQAVRLFMPSLKIGVRTTTDLAHLFASLSESSDTLGSAALTGTLIPHLWKSAIFWNVSTRDGVHWNSFVVDWVLLPKFQGLFVPGKARNSLFRSRPLFFGVIALRVYFRRPRPPSSLAGFCSMPPDGKCYQCLYTRVMRTFRFGPIRFLSPRPLSSHFPFPVF